MGAIDQWDNNQVIFILEITIIIKIRVININIMERIIMEDIIVDITNMDCFIDEPLMGNQKRSHLVLAIMMEYYINSVCLEFIAILEVIKLMFIKQEFEVFTMEVIIEVVNHQTYLINLIILLVFLQL